MIDGQLIISDELADTLLALVERDGYFNDESTCLGSVAMEHYTEVVIGRLRELGYEGPDLELGGKYYPNHGAVYWLFNPSRMDYREARLRTDRWVANQSSLVLSIINEV